MKKYVLVAIVLGLCVVGCCSRGKLDSEARKRFGDDVCIVKIPNTDESYLCQKSNGEVWVISTEFYGGTYQILKAVK